MTRTDRHVRLAGKLDVLRHSDRMFTLIVVTGVAKFRSSGSVLRIEAGRIERANARDLSLCGADPRAIFGVLDERILRQPQGPRSGVNAIFGLLADVESDDDIIEALGRLS